MTREICLRVYLLCVGLVGFGVSVSMWRTEFDSGFLMRSAICAGAFLWGCVAATLFSLVAVGVVAAACFIFFGSVPPEIQGMLP